MGATFNFTNAIVGAGAMGLGGAIAESGGLVSILSCFLFGTLAKLSCDQVVSLRIHLQEKRRTAYYAPRTIMSYETIGEACFGAVGKMLVLLSKSFFALGCLVAYVIVIKDNFAKGLEGVIYGNNNPVFATNADTLTTTNGFRSFLQNDVEVALVLCTGVILPICLFRDVSYLAKVSFLSILSTLSMVGIVVYLYFFGNVAVPSEGGYVKHWPQVRTGIFQR